ncbi:MAG TPA: nuclear transport factor 2 family protein [Gemmatimonadaceae bacterium]|nr:nuclear transport factor 2 family protein [Gemmatimonadaceae bacterium]
MVRLSLAALSLTAIVAGSVVIVPGSTGEISQGTPPQAPAPLPTVTLPPELDRVLRDYEKHWKANDGTALSELFTEDGFINRNGWIRGRDAIRQAYARSGGDLRLRALGYAAGDTVGYIVGGYRYGEATTDGGKFILTLRRAPQGVWKIAADLDAANRQ